MSKRHGGISMEYVNRYMPEEVAKTTKPRFEEMDEIIILEFLSENS